MDYKYKLSESELLKKAKELRLSESELIQITKDFLKYLKYRPFGTIRTYPDGEIVKEVMKNYPGTIPEQYGERRTKEIKDEIMADYIMRIATNEKIKNSVPHIQFCMNYINGKEDSIIDGLSRTFIINSMPQSAENGKYTPPEPKEGCQEN